MLEEVLDKLQGVQFGPMTTLVNLHLGFLVGASPQIPWILLAQLAIVVLHTVVNQAQQAQMLAQLHHTLMPMYSTLIDLSSNRPQQQRGKPASLKVDVHLRSIWQVRMFLGACLMLITTCRQLKAGKRMLTTSILRPF